MFYAKFVSIFNFLFPKKCVSCGKFGDYLCPSCFATLSFDVPLRCLVCGKSAIYGLTHPACKNKYSIDGAFCGVVYAKSTRKLIASLKYSPYVKRVSFLLSQLVWENVSQNEGFSEILRLQPTLVPIPLSQGKMRKRGYNQAHILAKELGKQLGLTVKDCLNRIKDTKPQFGLTRKERRENVIGSFALKDIINKDILLVDDVLTTGATVMEAAKILKQNGANYVWALCVAAD